MILAKINSQNRYQQTKLYKLALTVIRLIASLLADGTSIERGTPASFNRKIAAEEIVNYTTPPFEF